MTKAFPSLYDLYDKRTILKHDAEAHRLACIRTECPVCKQFDADIKTLDSAIVPIEREIHEYRNGGPDWKKQTCKDCHFRVGSECRRFPPQETVQAYAYEDSTGILAYPDVEFASEEGDEKAYSDACAEWKRDEAKEKEGN